MSLLCLHYTRKLRRSSCRDWLIMLKTCTPTIKTWFARFGEFQRPSCQTWLVDCFASVSDSPQPLDCSINPHVQIDSAGGVLTTAIRLLVLNDIHRLAVEEATTTTNRTSVLAKSRVLVHKPVQREESSRNVQAVYPVTSEARSLAAQRMLQSSNIVSVRTVFLLVTDCLGSRALGASLGSSDRARARLLNLPI